MRKSELSGRFSIAGISDDSLKVKKRQKLPGEHSRRPLPQVKTNTYKITQSELLERISIEENRNY